MAKDNARISDAEWKVMEVLWQQGPCTTARVWEAVADTGWSRNTVATFLTRLEQKGYLKALPGTPRQYAARADREACLSRENRSFVQRVYHGSVGMLLAAFLKESPLAPDEADQLRKMLDEAEARQKEDGHE